MATNVIPPLHFGHLSYTPPPGYSGHFPGVRDQIPGLAYSDTLRVARKDAIWANVDRPQVWRPLISREFSDRGRSRDPSRALTDPFRSSIPEQHSPRNTAPDQLDSVLHNPISNTEGIVPGYAGFIPHIRSNSIPGFNFKRLTRNKGETARLNRDAIHYVTENRQAYEEAAAAIVQDQIELTPQDSSGPIFYQDSGSILPDRHPAATEEPPRDYSNRYDLTEEEFIHCNSVWLDFHSKLEEHFRLPSASFRRMDEARKGYIDPSDVRKMMNLLSIEASDKVFLCIMQALGCNAEGHVTVVDFMRAADLAFAEALVPRTVPVAPSTARPSTRSRPRFMQATCSDKNPDGPERIWRPDTAGSGTELPTILIKPRTDPTMQFALDQGAAKKGVIPPSPARDSEMQGKHGKAFGKAAIAGYQGHVGKNWRSREGEQLQNQLLLRVKPALRAKPARLRTETEEAEENSSEALKEAKAAWALILSNFAEFRKVQKAFRMVDKDFSGIISREELRHLIENVLYIAVSDAAFDIIFNTMDSDRSGELTFDEFAAAISDPDIQLTEAVSDSAEAQTGLARQAMYDQLLRSKDLGRVFDTGPSRDLDGKYERLRIGDRQWTIQNLRKIIEKRFFEIRNSFRAEDPERRGAVPRDTFVLLVRRNHIAPEGGDAAMDSLVAALDPEATGIVDYLELLKGFESVDPRLRMADGKVAVKAAVERKLAGGGGGGPTTPGGGEADVEAAYKKKRTDDQSTSQDHSKGWQQADRPGYPTAETRRAFQHRARQLGLSVVGEAGGGEPPARPRSPIFPLRSRGGATSRAVSERSEGDGERRTLYGVELGTRRAGSGRAGSGAGAEDGEGRQLMEGFSAVAVQSAREAWDLVRLSSESAFGSAQKAFRSVDKDASGRIELGELRHLLTVNLNIDIEEEAVSVIMKALDRGDKGNVTYTEFISALRAPLLNASQMEPATALEMEQHPLDPHFGRRMAGERPPQMHQASYDHTLTTATQAGNAVLAKGASRAQYGDRYAWKASMPYSTAQRDTIGAVGQLRLPADSGVGGLRGGGLTTGPLSLEKTARRAGVLFLEPRPPPPTDGSWAPGASGGYSPPSTGRRGSPPPAPSPAHAKKQYDPLDKDRHPWSPSQAKEVSKIYFLKGAGSG